MTLHIFPPTEESVSVNFFFFRAELFVIPPSRCPASFFLSFGVSFFVSYVLSIMSSLLYHSVSQPFCYLVYHVNNDNDLPSHHAHSNCSSSIILPLVAGGLARLPTVQIMGWVLIPTRRKSSTRSLGCSSILLGW